MSIPQASQLMTSQQGLLIPNNTNALLIPEALANINIETNVESVIPEMVSPEMVLKSEKELKNSKIESLESKLFEIHNIKDYETTPVNNNTVVHNNNTGEKFYNTSKDYETTPVNNDNVVHKNNNGEKFYNTSNYNTSNYNVYNNIIGNYNNNDMKKFVKGVRKRIAGKNQEKKISMLNSIEIDLRLQLADAKFKLAKLDFYLENRHYYEKNLENLLNLKINREENLKNLIAKIINEKIRWEINRERFEKLGIEQTKWSPSELDYDTEQQMIDLVKSEIELVKSKLEHDFKLTKTDINFLVNFLEKKIHNKLGINRPGVLAPVVAEPAPTPEQQQKELLEFYGITSDGHYNGTFISTPTTMLLARAAAAGTLTDQMIQEQLHGRGIPDRRDADARSARLVEAAAARLAEAAASGEGEGEGEDAEAAAAAAAAQNPPQSPGTGADKQNHQRPRPGSTDPSLVAPHGGRNRKISRKKKNKTSLLKRKYKKQTRKYRKTKKRKLYKQ